MARISGVDLPRKKRVHIALVYLRDRSDVSVGDHREG